MEPYVTAFLWLTHHVRYCLLCRKVEVVVSLNTATVSVRWHCVPYGTWVKLCETELKLAWSFLKYVVDDELLAGGVVVALVVVLHNVCGLGIGYLLGKCLRLSESKRRAIAIEVGMQNSGLASSLASIHFAAYPLATIPGAIFSVWHNISGALVAKVFADLPYSLGSKK